MSELKTQIFAECQFYDVHGHFVHVGQFLYFFKIDKFEYILIKSNDIFFSLQFEWCDFIIIILDLKKKKKGTAYILRFWRLT